MMDRKRKLIVACISLMLLGSLVRPVYAAAPYRVRDLGNLGQPIGIAYGINNDGQIVGWSGSPAGADAFLWQDGKMTDLGKLPGGIASTAAHINESGAAVGWNYDAHYEVNEQVHAVLWQDGAIQDLGTLGGPLSLAESINARGQVVGFSKTASGDQHAFLWQDGIMTDLGTLPDAWTSFSQAYAINARGQVAGWSDSPEGGQHAVLWQNGSVLDLGTLGGSNSLAQGINGRGQVVGWALTDSGERHAFLWTKGAMRDLGTLGGNVSEAYGINARGQVVGYSKTASGEQHAFVWQNGVMTDLGTLPGNAVSVALAINDVGWIVGQSDGHAVLWTR